MPTQTKRQEKITVAPHDAKSKSSRTTLNELAAANARDADELFKKGQRILAGENPLKVFPKEKPTAERKPFICGSQEEIADAVAEMITTGGTEENLTMVIQAVIDHDWRRRFDQGVNEGPSAARYPKFLENATRRVLDELAVARTKRTVLEVGERPEPTDVVGRIRENAREQCASNLQELLDSATPEECRFINSMMCSYRSAHKGEAGYGDMGLASAFQEEIDQRQYLRVPAHLMGDVWQYMDALIKAYPNEKPEVED